MRLPRRYRERSRRVRQNTPRFALERADDGRLRVRWLNPPLADAALSALELREIAAALLDMQRLLDDDGRRQQRAPAA